jgi:hypothetical protein
MTADDGPGQWHEYRRLVIDQLERLGEETSSIRESTVKAINGLRDVIDGNNRGTSNDIAALRERIARIEGKAAAYGFVAGLVVSLIVGALQFVPRQAPIPHPKAAMAEVLNGYSLAHSHDRCHLHSHVNRGGKLRPEALPRGSSKMRVP